MSSPRFVRRYLRIDDQHQRQLMQHADRNEILLRIVAQILVERRPDAERAVGAEQHGVTIRRRLRHRFGADIAAGTGPVFDDDLLAEPLRHRGCDRARQHVGGAAGREGDDHGDGPLGIVCRVRRCAGERSRGKGGERECKCRQRRRVFKSWLSDPFPSWYRQASRRTLRSRRANTIKQISLSNMPIRHIRAPEQT